MSFTNLWELMFIFNLGVMPVNSYVNCVAEHFGVDPRLATLTWKYESNYGQDVYGDWCQDSSEFLAQGPWQIHPGTWLYLVDRFRREYGAPPEWDRLYMRHNMEASTVITMYGISIGYGDWWAGYRKAKRTLAREEVSWSGGMGYACSPIC